MSNSIIVKDLVWDKWNRVHIEKHNLTPKQVEQVFLDNKRVYQKSYNNRIMIIGKCGKRIISTIMAKEGKKYYVITARDASKEERLNYYEN
ncbi:MAG: BrnT family toxin [bacterium]|nr:BrnT family toxin [bacterium]